MKIIKTVADAQSLVRAMKNAEATVRAFKRSIGKTADFEWAHNVGDERIEVYYRLASNYNSQAWSQVFQYDYSDGSMVVDSSNWEEKTGEKPSGTGYWAFIMKLDGVEPWVFRSGALEYKLACKQATAEAVNCGYTSVTLRHWG